MCIAVCFSQEENVCCRPCLVEVDFAELRVMYATYIMEAKTDLCEKFSFVFFCVFPFAPVSVEGVHEFVPSVVGGCPQA